MNRVCAKRTLYISVNLKAKHFLRRLLRWGRNVCARLIESISIWASMQKDGIACDCKNSLHLVKVLESFGCLEPTFIVHLSHLASIATVTYRIWWIRSKVLLQYCARCRCSRSSFEMFQLQNRSSSSALGKSQNPKEKA